jgi:hypothetical protein
MAQALGEMLIYGAKARPLLITFIHDAPTLSATGPATKKQKLLLTPPATQGSQQDSQSSFADVLERIQLDARENTGAFLSPLYACNAH